MKARFILFTDGAASGNPGPGGWGAVIFDRQEETITELGAGSRSSTNNRMEIEAAIRGLQQLGRESDPIEVWSDSSYVIQGIQSWIKTWKRNGWKTKSGDEVLNQDLWKTLDRLNSDLSVKWKKVKAHAGWNANERADQIAVSFSRGEETYLFSGPVTKSDFTSEDFDSIPEETPGRGKSASSPEQGYPTYLSYVDGSLAEHSTWAECQNRVSGRARARFKKVKSSAERKKILKEWGIIDSVESKK